MVGWTRRVETVPRRRSRRIRCPARRGRTGRCRTLQSDVRTEHWQRARTLLAAWVGRNAAGAVAEQRDKFRLAGAGSTKAGCLFADGVDAAAAIADAARIQHCPCDGMSHCGCQRCRQTCTCEGQRRRERAVCRLAAAGKVRRVAALTDGMQSTGSQALCARIGPATRILSMQTVWAQRRVAKHDSGCKLELCCGIHRAESVVLEQTADMSEHEQRRTRRT